MQQVQLLKQPFKTPFKHQTENDKNQNRIKFKSVKSSERNMSKRSRPVYAYADDSDNGHVSEDGDSYNGDSGSDFDSGPPRKKTKSSNSARKPLSNLSTNTTPITRKRTDKSTVRDPIKVLGSKFKIPSFAKKVINGMDSMGKTNIGTLGIRSRELFSTRTCLYDHTAEDALILYDPEEEDDVKGGKEQPKEKPVVKAKSVADILGIRVVKHKKVHVVVDPCLSSVLRPHQVEGVKFLYKCTTGRLVPNTFGCIMADEMGLGKTLQCIVLLWTLLRQSPEPNKGTIDKCIIACPSSLVRNWANELVKWLGSTKIRPLAVDHKGVKESLIRDLRHFASAQGRSIMNPVLIISYETLRTHIAELQNCQIGLLLCDEGHRLKNSNSLTFQALNSLQVQRRVILSGTPIQNDLSEYFSLLNFANPGLLGTPAEFRKNYEIPILRGRDADASNTERELSDQKLTELWGFVSKFIIRRTNDILSKYLPVKYEHVVFCRLSEFQTKLYNLFLTSPEIKCLLRGVGSQPLKAITMLKKLCNHPDLLNLPRDLSGSERCFPEGYSIKEKVRHVRPEFSGKMTILARMLEKIRNETDDKIVLISNYTQTLDLFEKLCRNRKYGCLRLDGSMSIQKRQKLVDRFNDPEGKEFVFLLSSKAGGCGLNLIGANRLILFDPDWNPAADQQALARVWRDGQKKNCFIYRFIGTGTIEEKIFQRQSHKQSLSSCVVDEDAEVERHFSLESLRQLFQFNPDTMCETHGTFKCSRCIDGVQKEASKCMNYGDTSTWNHFTGSDDLENIHDSILREANDGIVSYVFEYISH